MDNSEGTTLTLIDAASLKSIGEIAVGEKPHGLAASPDSRRVYASVLENWLGADSSAVLDGTFATVPIL